jgi:1-acyl-sn-glycerol-3-phosphate acyltransferase
VNAPWKYETAEDLDQPLTERLRHFPREPDLFVYGLRSLCALSIRAWLKIYHRFTIHGREYLPFDRSFVLVANHSSHLDTLCLLASLPLGKLHRAFPAAAADYFFETVPRIWVAAVMVNALPFAREVHIRQSLDLCQQLLLNPGNILILFPEGTRSMTGELGRFKPGIGLLAAGRDIPVVPCFLDGAFRAWRKGRWAPRPTKIHLRFGEPKNFRHLLPGKESACAIAAELQTAVRQLSPSYEND